MVSSRDRTLEFRQALTSLNPKFQGKVNSSGDSTASIKLLNASSKVVGMMTCVRNQIKENRQRYLDVSDLDERSKGLEWRRELEDMIREFSVQTEMSIDTLRESLDQSKQTILQSNRDLAMFYSGVIAYLYEMLKSISEEFSVLKKQRQHAMLKLSKIIKPVKLEEPQDLSIHETERLSQHFLDEEIVVLSQSERQILEEQNELLLQEFESEIEAAKGTESRVLEISELVSIFSSKILEQQESIDQIHRDTINSSQNTSSAEKELQKSLKRQESGRNLLLSFILGATISLLFLHWISD